MTDALPLINALSKDGKSPLEIARELHSRGVTDRRGRMITPAVVEGMLRFAELAPRPPAEKITGAVWGTRADTAIPESAAPAAKKRGRKPGVTFKTSWNLSAEARTGIEQLYFKDHLSAGEIAAQLRLPYRRVTMYCGHLAGFTIPPGEIEEYIDEQGLKVLKCPPAFARGVYPQRNVGAKGGW